MILVAAVDFERQISGAGKAVAGLGQHTREVLAEAGLSTAEIEAVAAVRGAKL